MLQGGTRVREHPLPGIAMNTYEPSTLAVGEKKMIFILKKEKFILNLIEKN
jgi:hypothetical protein